MASRGARGKPRYAAFGPFIALFAFVMVAGCLTTSNEKADIPEEPNVNRTYTVCKAVTIPDLTGQWNGAAWAKAETFVARHFHEKSSSHHPKVEGKMLYDDKGVYIIFRVDDRYVVSKYTQFQDPVCKDSCVEFFVQPKPGKGYFNLEVNCGGTYLLQYHEQDTSGKDVSKSVSAEHAQGIRVYHSMPQQVSPEIAENTTWCVEYFIPFSVFEPYVGPVKATAGQTWRANFYKCADESSHPHWAAWAPIDKELSFHQPRFFGTIRFAP